MSSGDNNELEWLGELRVLVLDPRKESHGAQQQNRTNDTHAPTTRGSQTFVSYGVRAETNLPHFSRTYMVTRKRFQDFVFLHDALVSDFPACIVPPLPGKHRIGTYGTRWRQQPFTGDDDCLH